MWLRRLLPVAASLLAAAAASAQTTDAEIKRGIAAYENFQVEGARAIFKNIVSPSNPVQVSTEQRVTAYKYLGASYAVIEKADSAKLYFGAALELDPFTDLDPNKFSESEQGPFNLAKLDIFKIGVRPPYAAVVTPSADSTFYRFQLVTTHAANVQVELLKQPQGTVAEQLFDGRIDGPRDLRWDGFSRMQNKIIDSATYILRVTAQSAKPGEGANAPRVTEQQFLKVEHSFEPLEDTLPVLPASMLLPDRIQAWAPWQDLAKGAILAGVVGFALPRVILDSTSNYGAHQTVISITGLAAGFGSWWYRSRKREIPENVAENARRLQQRADFNAAVRSRNQERIGRTKLIITPLTGVR